MLQNAHLFAKIGGSPSNFREIWQFFQYCQDLTMGDLSVRCSGATGAHAFGVASGRSCRPTASTRGLTPSFGACDFWASKFLVTGCSAASCLVLVQVQVHRLTRNSPGLSLGISSPWWLSTSAIFLLHAIILLVISWFWRLSTSRQDSKTCINEIWWNMLRFHALYLINHQTFCVFFELWAILFYKMNAVL